MKKKDLSLSKIMDELSLLSEDVDLSPLLEMDDLSLLKEEVKNLTALIELRGKSIEDLKDKSKKINKNRWFKFLGAGLLGGANLANLILLFSPLLILPFLIGAFTSGLILSSAFQDTKDVNSIAKHIDETLKEICKEEEEMEELLKEIEEYKQTNHKKVVKDDQPNQTNDCEKEIIHQEDSILYMPHSGNEREDR